MPICPNCNKRINKGTANKRKIKGVFIHKECPNERLERKDFERRQKKTNKNGGLT